jgi:hypothetical protein
MVPDVPRLWLKPKQLPMSGVTMSGSGIHFEWRPWHDWAMVAWAMWQGWLNASVLHAHITSGLFHNSPDVFAFALFLVTLMAWWLGYDSAVNQSRQKVKTNRAMHARRRRATRRRRKHLYKR